MVQIFTTFYQISFVYTGCGSRICTPFPKLATPKMTQMTWKLFVKSWTFWRQITPSNWRISCQNEINSSKFAQIFIKFHLKFYIPTGCEGRICTPFPKIFNPLKWLKCHEYMKIVIRSITIWFILGGANSASTPCID